MSAEDYIDQGGLGQGGGSNWLDDILKGIRAVGQAERPEADQMLLEIF